MKNQIDNSKLAIAGINTVNDYDYINKDVLDGFEIEIYVGYT